MPKQKGPVYITGTIGDICYYKMDGKYYYRRKSSLSRKRVKKDAAFALTRVYADLLSKASQLSSAIYRQLPKAKKRLTLYRAMTGEALQLLKQGVAVEIINETLQAHYRVKTAAAKEIIAGKDTSAVANPLTTAAAAPAHEINKRSTAPLKTTAPAHDPGRRLLTTRQQRVQKTWHLSMTNIHIALPSNVRMYVTPEGHLEVRLTNKRMKAV